MIGTRARTNSQKSSRISYAAHMFCSRITCSTCPNRYLHMLFYHIVEQTSELIDITDLKDRNQYPNPSYWFLPGLQELCYLLAHMLQLQIPLILQQLDSRNCQAQASFATKTPHYILLLCIPKKNAQDAIRLFDTLIRNFLTWKLVKNRKDQPNWKMVKLTAHETKFN